MEYLGQLFARLSEHGCTMSHVTRNSSPRLRRSFRVVFDSFSGAVVVRSSGGFHVKSDTLHV
jgi:hypothetical protein